MADNYLEKKMDDYRHGKVDASLRRFRSKKLMQPVEATHKTVGVALSDSSLARALASALRKCGSKVAFVDTDRRRGSELAQRSGSLFIPVDELSENAIHYMIQVVNKRWGSLDLLITDNEMHETMSETLSDADKMALDVRNLVIVSVSATEDLDAFGGRMIEVCEVDEGAQEVIKAIEECRGELKKIKNEIKLRIQSTI